MRRFLLLAACALLATSTFLLGSCGDDEARSGVRTLVLVTLDTLRRDHVRAYAPQDVALPQPPTETLDRLAAAGLRFDDARTPVPLTLPAHTTMLTGLPPAATGVRLNTYGRLPPPAERPFPLLAERLRAAGWRTAAFVSADALSARYGLDQGFERYDDAMPTDERRSAVQLAERPGRATVAEALRYVRSVDAGDKLFLWVHLFEPHAPYAADGSYGGDVEDCDRIVGELMAGLARAGRPPGAGLLFCADHGEALGELGERSHGFLLADHVLRVPFLLLAPGIEPGARSDPADLADVAPTLAGLAGVDWPATRGPGCGLDLLARAAPADRVRIAESLYGHHLHRWAQLLAAVSPAGTLVDAGTDRLHWVPPSPYQRSLGATGVVLDGDATRSLARSLVEYRQFEKPTRMRGGQVAAGYGGGGVVEGFLPAPENRRLHDPHHALPSHYRLDAIKTVVSSPRSPPRALRTALGALDALDQPHLLEGSPELHFWRGEVRLRLAPHAADEAGPLLSAAEAAYLRAFELGRKDTQTLARACGVNAQGRERACLERLEDLVQQVPQPGCQYWILKIRLLRDLGETEAAEAACRAAEAHCRGTKGRALWQRACR